LWFEESNCEKARRSKRKGSKGKNQEDIFSVVSLSLPLDRGTERRKERGEEKRKRFGRT